MVRPSIEALSATRRSNRAATGIRSPPVTTCVSGLKHSGHASEQPCTHRTARTPGPLARLRGRKWCTRKTLSCISSSSLTILTTSLSSPLPLPLLYLLLSRLIGFWGHLPRIDLTTERRLQVFGQIETRHALGATYLDAYAAILLDEDVDLL